MKEQKTKTKKSKIRLLVVDDSKIVRDRLRHLCASIPRVAIIAEAKNGLEALSIIRQIKPDVITLDIRMPVMNGIEVLEAMKQEQLSGTVIVLSAIEETIYRKKCLELGASYVLNKTFKVEKLLMILSDL